MVLIIQYYRQTRWQGGQLGNDGAGRSVIFTGSGTVAETFSDGLLAEQFKAAAASIGWTVWWADFQRQTGEQYPGGPNSRTVNFQIEIQVDCGEAYNGEGVKRLLENDGGLFDAGSVSLTAQEAGNENCSADTGATPPRSTPGSTPGQPPGVKPVIPPAADSMTAWFKKNANYLALGAVVIVAMVAKAK